MMGPSCLTEHRFLDSCPKPSLPRLFSGVGLLILVLALAACDVSLGTVPTTATAASDLDASILLLNDDPGAGGTVTADMALSLNGTVVTSFSQGETVTCNGVALKGSILGFAGQVPVQSNSGAYVFIYTEGQNVTSVTVPVRRGKILSPLEFSSHPRSMDLAITYVRAMGPTTVTGYARIDASVSTSTQSSFQTGGSQQNNGTYNLSHSVLSLLPAGNGTIELDWGSTDNGTVSGPPFHSLTTKYGSSISEKVIWS